MPDRPRALVFDFNGTISDDEQLLARLYEELFAELGRPITPEQYLTELAGHTDEEMLTRWLGRADQAVIDERIRRYSALVADGSTVDEETRAAVRFAAERVPVGIVSAAPLREIAPVLDAAGLRGSFSVVVSDDDVSRGKPDPEGYLKAAAMLDVAPTAMVVFEDTDIGVTAALAAGAHVVGLTRTLGHERMSIASEVAPRVDLSLVARILCS